MDKVVASQGVLLQYHSSHVHWDEPIQGIAWLCNVPFQLIMTEDDSIAYTTPVGYSQQGKGSQGGLFGVTRLKE
jgi:hypothetical protein